MYELFTDRARKIMQLANLEAQRFNHEYIGTEHILLGLMKEGSGVAAHVLKDLHIDLRRIRFEVEKLLTVGPTVLPTPTKLPMTPRAKKAIECAMKEAVELKHNYVGSEHLLLGLLREKENVAAQVLGNLGLEMEDARSGVRELLGEGMAGARDARAQRLRAQVQALSAEGLPPEEVEAAAPCPKCGNPRPVRILWNRVELDGRDAQKVVAGRAILAVCVTANLPSRACLACEPRWSEVHRLALQDYQWQMAKDEAIGSGNRVTAERIGDAQLELRPRLVALAAELIGRQ